jgi:hypothetical protein
MSDVASLELCRELYELSGWKTFAMERGLAEDRPIDPAYDLGYLLRKLQRNHVELVGLTTGEWTARAYWHSTEQARAEYADTPEDAAAKLAIELFKQGILTKEGA